jgi:hypothetical protein
MCLQFLGSEYILEIFLVQFLINIGRHFLDGLIAGNFLYILLSLIAQQALPEILPEDLIG